MTAVSVEPITHLDEDWAVPCERLRLCRGSNEAEWIVWVDGCCPTAPVRFLWCQPCLDAALASTNVATCRHCGCVFKPVRTAFRLIEPLNRRTT